MPTRLNRLISFILFLLSVFQLHDKAAGATDGYKLFQDLQSLELDASRVADVSGITITRDVATFHLSSGQIILFQPVEGKVTGAVFTGVGRFHFNPPTSIEKYQLEKFTGQSSLDLEITQLYLRFTDSTAEEFSRALNFVPAAVPAAAGRIKGGSEDRIPKTIGESIDILILQDLLFDGSDYDRQKLFSGLFYADMRASGENRLIFHYDPKMIEEVTLIRETSALQRFDFDLVCSFHKQSDYRGEEYVATNEDLDLINPEHYRMEISFETSGKIDIKGELSYVPLISGQRVLIFDLERKVEKKYEVEYDTVKIDEVRFISDKDIYGMAAILPEPLTFNQKQTLAFHLWGDFLVRNSYGDFYIDATVGWYPRYDYLMRSTYDLTFKIPKSYKFVSSGTKTKEWKEGSYLYSHWVEELPVKTISFNIGNFEVYKKKEEGLPEIQVYWNKQTHALHSQHLTEQRNTPVLVGKDMEKNVAADVLNSLNFFQKLFVEYPFKQLAVTEIPASHGQAFSGLLHLSYGTFQEEKEDQFWEEYFRAHEVSHQWWGHMVRWKSYHDQWLSEGFADYCGAWYAQLSMNDSKKFFENLKEWRDNVIKGNVHMLSEGTVAGPIWLGYRLNSSKSLDYSTIVYQKGAYVLHMLRNMMMDFDTRSDTRFAEMLGDFARTYNGKDATTSDFQKIVEKHMGQDMDWFFKQWVYGIDIPKYKYSYTTQKVGDKTQVTLKVKQEGVPSDFKMQVPVVMVYAGDAYSVLRVWVDQPEKVITLPLVPGDVKDVVFNPYFSVLCEVEKE